MRHAIPTKQILILGGGYAGMMAAARIARGASNAMVTLIDAKPAFEERIRFHEALAGTPLKPLPYAPLLARRGVRFLQGRVEGLDPQERRVAVRGPQGEKLDLAYDALVYALGSATAASVPGVAENAIRVDVPGSLKEMRGRVLVAGSGLTGIEVATELAERHPALRITLATRGRLGDGYSPRGAEHFRRRFAELGIELVEETSIVAVEPGRALLAGGGELPFDQCVWAGGFAAPPLAREAGFPLDAQGRIRVEPDLRVAGFPEIFAVGDAAAAPYPGGDPIRMGCVSALPMGAHAGEGVRRLLRGQATEPFRMDFVIRCISLGRRDGLVQFVHGNDELRDRVLTGRLGAWVKELVCQMTRFVVRNELRWGVRLYRWPQPATRLTDRSGRIGPVESAG